MSERRYRHPQVNLRLPEELKDKVSELATVNGRSMNAEMVAAIEAWVHSDGKSDEAESQDQLRKLVDRIKGLHDKYEKLDEAKDYIIKQKDNIIKSLNKQVEMSEGIIGSQEEMIKMLNFILKNNFNFDIDSVLKPEKEHKKPT